jgi:hypothetical protein
LLVNISLNDENDENVRIAAIEKLKQWVNSIPITEQNKLAEIAQNHKVSVVRQQAIKKLDPNKNQDLLVNIALNDYDGEVQMAVIKKLDSVKNQDVFAKIALNNVVYDCCIEAVKKLDPDKNQDIIKKVLLDHFDFQYINELKILINKLNKNSLEDILETVINKVEKHIGEDFGKYDSIEIANFVKWLYITFNKSEKFLKFDGITLGYMEQKLHEGYSYSRDGEGAYYYDFKLCATIRLS